MFGIIHLLVVCNQFKNLTSYSKFNMLGDKARTLDVRLPSLMGVF